MTARKPRRMTPYTSQWEKMANALARSHAPEIYPCGKGGGPVVKRYCCTRCGTIRPEVIR